MLRAKHFSQVGCNLPQYPPRTTISMQGISKTRKKRKRMRKTKRMKRTKRTKRMKMKRMKRMKRTMRTMRMRWMKMCKESWMKTPPRVSSPLNFLYR